MKKKHNCYNCIYRDTVTGSAHSSCKAIPTDKGLHLLLALGSVNLVDKNTNEPLVKKNPVGVKNGWCLYPINFDPVWIDQCKFYSPNK